MGLSKFPAIINLFKTYLESKAVKSLQKLCHRYLDDIFVIWSQESPILLEYLNFIVLKIQFS